MSCKLTDKCPLTVILQLVGDQTYDLSAYGSKEEAWDAEKGEYWVEGAENIDEARSEFMGTLYEYSQEEVVSAALDEQAWPFDWGYVTATTDIEQGYCQIDGGAVYECWYPKNRTFWNGWACPAGLTAKSLCDFLAVSLQGRSSEVDLELCTELLTSIVTQDYGDLTIYGIGDGLIWDECTADGNVDAYRAEDAE